MNKQQFLEDEDVIDFVKWLALQLGNKMLLHTYEMPGGGNFTFNGLEDALAQYDWPFKYEEPPVPGSVRSGHTYADNDTALTVLCAGLRREIASLNDTGVRDWAVAVMGWGGVKSGNATWLNANVNGLATEVSAAKDLLQRGDDDKLILGAIRRFNAGMSKVYSLLAPNFIIYDSRVAAALTWLIVRWCMDTERTTVPDKLRFPCMRPKEGDNPAIRKLRNPSCGNYSFPWMNNHTTNHAHWNIRASWILSEALSNSRDTQFHTQSKPLRSLEAALFMWGYDLSKNSPCGGIYKDEDREEDEEPDKYPEPKKPEWQKSNTLGGGNAVSFEWCFDQQSDCIAIKRANSEVEDFKVGEIFLLIHVLHDIFGSDCFPLANSVTGMPNGTEKRGLGSTIYALSTICGSSRKVSHAQAASQLGVVLMEVAIFEFCDQGRSIAWRLRVDPPATIEELRMVLARS